MKSISAEAFSRIDLGQRGEHFARQILFDLTSWREIYGDGHAALLAELPEQSVPYPCSTFLEGNTLVWPISSADTSVAGKGRCELSYYVGDQLVKSTVYSTFIAESLAEPGEVPEAYEAWVDDVFKAKNEVIEAKETIENMSVSAQTLPSEATAGVTKVVTDNGLHLIFGIPKGAAGSTGATGSDGKDGYTPLRGVDYMTEEDFAYFDTHIDERLGAVGDALDELHAYAQALVTGGDGA